MKQFCNGDPLDVDFRRRIIDVFINSVFLYDDKVIIYYNIQGGKQISFIEMIDSVKKSNTPPDLSLGAEGVRISNDMLHQRKAAKLLGFGGFLFSLNAWNRRLCHTLCHAFQRKLFPEAISDVLLHLKIQMRVDVHSRFYVGVSEPIRDLFH